MERTKNMKQEGKAVDNFAKQLAEFEAESEFNRIPVKEPPSPLKRDRITRRDKPTQHNAMTHAFVNALAAVSRVFSRGVLP